MIGNESFEPILLPQRKYLPEFVEYFDPGLSEPKVFLFFLFSFVI